MPLRKRSERKDPVHEIRRQVGVAILTAKDAIDNLLEYIQSRARMAQLTVRECEEELDRLERRLDDEIPIAMVQVDERTARELIACLRFITDLERIGDLAFGALKRYDEAHIELKPRDRELVSQMLGVISGMIQSVHKAFTDEDTAIAREVIARDREIDAIHHTLLTSHLRPASKNSSVEIVFLSQALERAGDHVTNLGEELIHLAEEQSIRHERRRATED